MFSFNDPDAFAWGGEPILMDGRSVGELTSAGYSRKHGRVLAMGYVRSAAPVAEAALLSSRYEIDVAGILCPVAAHLKLA